MANLEVAEKIQDEASKIFYRIAAREQGNLSASDRQNLSDWINICQTSLEELRTAVCQRPEEDSTIGSAR